MRCLLMLPVLAAAMIAGSPTMALNTKNPNTVPTRAKLFVSCSTGLGTSSETEPSLFCAGENSVGSATKDGPNGAVVSSFATSPGGMSGDTYRADSALTYAFVVWGGNMGDVIPIEIDYALMQDSTGPYSGVISKAQIGVLNPGGSGYVGDGIKEICTIGCAGSGGDAIELEGTLSLSLFAGTQYTVNIFAEAVATALGQSTFASASVDPYIYIDPSFADAAKYSVVVSEGVANVDPSLAVVPEPTSWAMMIAGFGLAGGVLRRRATATFA
jgi:hypothetical protein